VGIEWNCDWPYGRVAELLIVGAVPVSISVASMRLLVGFSNVCSSRVGNLSELSK
jgi:hypothetical protein